MLAKFYFKHVTNVLSVDIWTKFQRPLMKPYNFTARRHRIKTKHSLGLLFALNFHYAPYE